MDQPNKEKLKIVLVSLERNIQLIQQEEEISMCINHIYYCGITSKKAPGCKPYAEHSKFLKLTILFHSYVLVI